MKSFWPRVSLTLAALVLSACGGGGSSYSPAANMAPKANFAFVCADLACTFTNTSTDPDVGDTLTAYNWTFGDGTPALATRDVSHTFANAGSFAVTLRVTDSFGASTESSLPAVTVTAIASAGPAPHASFAVSCQSLDCTFTDTSTYDPGSTPQSRAWDFDDGVTLAAASPTTHRYTATTLKTFSIKLTVTDTSGKISTSTQSLPLAPPASSVNCVGGAGCTLQLLQASTVTATLVSRSCSAHGNVFNLTAPVVQTLFSDGCYATVGSTVMLNGGQRFPANTVLAAEVISGLSGTTGLAYLPSIRVTGDFASGWTLVFDDGYGGPGEPDFNDLVVLLKPTQ